MTELLVETNQGKVRGVQKHCRMSGKDYYSFFAIPYAKPPTGPLRFKPPVPISKWEGVLFNETETSGCMRHSPFELQDTGTEDCLYLNVHTTEKPCDVIELKPVVVLIHSGGHLFGSGSTKEHGGVDFVMLNDIVYVTFDYRLHVFGFLNLELPDCPGNVGIRDAVLVFRWVRENIKAFGGDPKNVTALGCSSAGSTIHLLMLSPNYNGLFEKAIIQGGYVFNPCSMFQENHLEMAFEYGHLLGFDVDEPKKLLRFLKKKSTKELMEAVLTVRFNDQKRKKGCYGYSSPFLPSVEKIITADTILPTSPRNLIDTIEAVPIIFGMCKNESLFMFTDDPMDLVKSDLRTVVERTLWVHHTPECILDEITEKIRKLYFNNEEITDEHMWDFIKMTTDAHFAEMYGTLIEAVNKTDSSKPTYVYKFVYEGDLNHAQKMFSSLLNRTIKGPSHIDDVFYWASDNTQIPNNKDVQMIKNFGSFFTSFARNGNPNSDQTSEVVWKSSTIENPKYLLIDEKLTMIEGKINDERFRFWDDIHQYIRDKNEEMKN